MVGRDGEAEINKRSVMCDNRENWVLGRSSSQCNCTELKVFDFMVERRRLRYRKGYKNNRSYTKRLKVGSYEGKM
jgi:hypothetical protein